MANPIQIESKENPLVSSIMSGTSPKAGETGGSPASSSPVVPGNNVPQQQPLQPQIPQQLSAVTNSGPSTAIHNGAPQQPLFLKPHPTILPTYSSNTPAISSSAITSTTAISTDKSPLATTKPVVGALPTPPSGTVAAPAISAPFNPHVARGQGVKEPLPTDVICGRGKMTASHPANRRFRELVDSHKASYQNSKRRDEKTRITCELVDKLRAEGRYVSQLHSVPEFSAIDLIVLQFIFLQSLSHAIPFLHHVQICSI